MKFSTILIYFVIFISFSIVWRRSRHFAQFSAIFLAVFVHFAISFKIPDFFQKLLDTGL